MNERGTFSTEVHATARSNDMGCISVWPPARVALDKEVTEWSNRRLCCKVFLFFTGAATAVNVVVTAIVARTIIGVLRRIVIVIFLSQLFLAFAVALPMP